MSDPRSAGAHPRPRSRARNFVGAGGVSLGPATTRPTSLSPNRPSFSGQSKRVAQAPSRQRVSAGRRCIGATCRALPAEPPAFTTLTADPFTRHDELFSAIGTFCTSLRFVHLSTPVYDLSACLHRLSQPSQLQRLTLAIVIAPVTWAPDLAPKVLALLQNSPSLDELSVATGKHHFTDRGNTVAFSCVLAEASRTLASSGSKATLTLLPRRGPMWHSCSTICILSMDKEGSSAAHYISERVNKKLTAAASERTTFTRNQSNQGASPGNAKQNLYNL